MKQKINSGFTLLEVLVVIAVFSMLLGLLTINLINSEPKASLNLDTATVIADIRNQQLKAMTGNSYNNLPSAYGVYLEADSYTLFAGNSFNSNDPGNAVFNLPENTSFENITFPGSIIVFQKGNGEISAGGNSFRIRNSISGESKLVTFNKLGVVTSVQ